MFERDVRAIELEEIRREEEREREIYVDIHVLSADYNNAIQKSHYYESRFMTSFSNPIIQSFCEYALRSNKSLVLASRKPMNRCTLLIAIR